MIEQICERWACDYFKKIANITFIAVICLIVKSSLLFLLRAEYDIRQHIKITKYKYKHKHKHMRQFVLLKYIRFDVEKKDPNEA